MEAARRPDRLGLPPIERYRQVAAEYAERCVRALNGNDLREALRAATISDAANRAVESELRFQERARELRERWDRERQPASGPGPRGLAVAR